MVKGTRNPTLLTLRDFKESKTVSGKKWFRVSGAWLGYASNKPFKSMSPNLRPPGLEQCRTCSWCSVIAVDLKWISITSHVPSLVSTFIWKRKLIISRWQNCYENYNLCSQYLCNRISSMTSALWVNSSWVMTVHWDLRLCINTVQSNRGVPLSISHICHFKFSSSHIKDVWGYNSVGRLFA